MLQVFHICSDAVEVGGLVFSEQNRTLIGLASYQLAILILLTCLFLWPLPLWSKPAAYWKCDHDYLPLLGSHLNSSAMSLIEVFTQGAGNAGQSFVPACGSTSPGLQVAPGRCERHARGRTDSQGETRGTQLAWLESLSSCTLPALCFSETWIH